MEQEAAYPIPISLYNCYRTVRHEKRYQEYSYASLLMPHCPVTVVQRYRDGVCSHLFHLFFITCHPYIPLHLLVLPIFGCADAGIELGLHRYGIVHTTSLITRVRVGEVGRAHYPKWRRSLLIRAETTRDVGLEKNDRLGTMHTSDHRRSVFSGFTPSFEVLGRLLKKRRRDESSDFAYKRFLVSRRWFVTTRKVFLWLEKGP